MGFIIPTYEHDPGVLSRPCPLFCLSSTELCMQAHHTFLLMQWSNIRIAELVCITVLDSPSPACCFISSLTISFFDKNLIPLILSVNTCDCETYIHGHSWCPGISAHSRHWQQFQGHSIQPGASIPSLGIFFLSCKVRFIMGIECYYYSCHYKVYFSITKFSKAQWSGFLFQTLFNKMQHGINRISWANSFESDSAPYWFSIIMCLAWMNLPVFSNNGMLSWQPCPSPAT